MQDHCLCRPAHSLPPWLQDAKVSVHHPEPSSACLLPGDQFTANSMCLLCCLLSPRPKARVTFLPDIKCSDSLSHCWGLFQVPPGKAGPTFALWYLQPSSDLSLHGLGRRRAGDIFYRQSEKNAKLRWNIQNNWWFRCFHLLTDQLQRALKSKPPKPVAAVDVSSPAADLRRTARGPSVGFLAVRYQQHSANYLE